MDKNHLSNCNSKTYFPLCILLSLFCILSLFFRSKTQTFPMPTSSSTNDSMMLPDDSRPATLIRVDNTREIDIEIVGLYCGSNGRSCCSHKICGQHVVPGDLLRLVQTVVEVNGEVEEANKYVSVVDGVDCCDVIFVPRVQATLKNIKNSIDTFVIVKEHYAFSDNLYKKEKSDKNRGMAGCYFLTSIDLNE